MSERRLPARRRRAARRRGLAPLELALWLPVLLFVAALMVIFGTLAAWRLRGDVVSHDAAWRTRWPRTGVNEPRPENRVWPRPARMEVEADAPVTQLDDPEIQHPVARGPLPGGFDVRPLLDPDHTGSIRGIAEIEREYPMLARLGSYQSGEIQHPLVDRKWSVAQMGIRTNKTRRIPALYELPKAPGHLPQAFISAVRAIFRMVHFDGLDVLDRDEDVRKYTGSYVDFHPRIFANIAEVVREIVRRRKITGARPNNDPIVDTTDRRGQIRLGEISQLPRTMTEFFLRMYERASSELMEQIEQWRQQQQQLPGQISDAQRLQRQLPSIIAGLRDDLADATSPGERARLQTLIDQYSSQLASLPGQIASMQNLLRQIPDLIRGAQAELAELEIKIEQLRQYRARLREIESRLRKGYSDYAGMGGAGGS